MSSYGILTELWKGHEGKKMYTFVNSHQTLRDATKTLRDLAKLFI